MTFKPRLLSVLIVLSLTLTHAFGQAPVITHIDKYIGGNGQRVTISGSNFGTNTANIIVWFGASKGVIETLTDQTIEVTVPAGATYESIVVTNLSTNKSASSKDQFMLSYGGEQPIALANLVPQTDLNTEAGLYDLCMCDLDNDGLTDVASSSSGGINPPANGVSIFKNNTAAPGSFSFASKVSYLPNTKTLNIKCGDLNGDGKKELIVSEADPGTRIFILKNNGSFSFVSQTISVAGTSPKRIDVADLNGDGLPELVVTDQNTANKALLIFRNTSAGASISFDIPVTLPVASTGSDGLAIQDMDNDNKPEIIISEYLSSTGNVYVYHNKSNINGFNFSEVVKADIAPGTPNSTGAPVNVKVGDFNGDSKPDIAVTHFLGSKISVVLNQSTGSTLAFGSATSIATDPYPFGLDAGDIDGDGKPDIVVASLTGPTPNAKSLTILNNTSSGSTVSFTRLTKTTTYINRHIAIGDLDGDAKPDIAYTSVDDDVNAVPASKISFFRNKSCIVPQITPDGSLTVCTTLPVTLEATKSAGATYAWKESGTANGVTTQTFTPSASGAYTVDITSDGCTRTSNIVNVTVTAGAAASPTINENSPLCEGGTVNLSIAAPVVTETYNWKGPGGFTASGSSITRPSYVPEFAGRYEVEVVTASGCVGAKGSVLVETISLPSFSVVVDGSDVICSTQTVNLKVSPSSAGYTYQWKNQSGNISGETGATYAAGATGTYSFKAKSTLYPGCPEVVSDAVDILKADVPSVAFDAPTETCKDVVTQFADHSLVEQSADPQYKWDFGDSGTGTGITTSHVYTAIANALTVSLTVSYRGNSCATTLTKSIKVSAPPTSATITTPGNVFEFCNGESISLGVSQSFSEYLWSTNETTPTIDVKTGGNFKVDVKNEIGCQLSITQQVTLKPSPAIAITAEKNPINLGESTKLSATSGFSAYEWTPEEGLDDATSQTPIATPQFTTNYKVTVLGANGCLGSDSLEVKVILDNPTNLLKISNFFSPNGDTSNPTWNVQPTSIMQSCGVTIFDEKGVKVFDARPYNNDWDGTSNGKKLPDGVYYYIIKCDGDSQSKTGSITILR